MRYIFGILICFTQFPVFAQRLSDVQWSNWIPISDRNENKVLFSFAYAKFDGYEKRAGLKWYFRIKNDYREDISGRFVYEYISKDGREHTNSYILHRLPGKTMESSELMFVTNVEKLTNVYFVEFSSLSPKSHLSTITIKDTALFRLQDAMISRQKLRVESGPSFQNSTTEVSGSLSKTDNFSDKTIYYKGENESIIRKLLSTVKGWRTNSTLRNQDGIPPEIPINSDCQRDQYAYSAILYAWAAESYYRVNEFKKAQEVAAKIPSLVSLITQFCGGNPNYVAENCKTAFIFPCNPNGNNNIQSASTGIPQNNSQGEISAKTSTSNIKEKELLFSLLPLVSTGFNPQDANFSNSFSGLMSKFDSYVDDDTTLGTGVKFFIKLANLHTMSQLREISGDKVSYNNFLDKISGGNGIGSNTNPDYTAISTFSANKPFNQMSADEMRTQIEPLLNAFGSLLEAGNDENGLTIKGEQKINDRYEAEREENKRLKIVYNFDMEDLKYAIKNFDNKLLDKILVTGFPIDRLISFSARNESDEQAVNYTTDNEFPKRHPKPIHYAAKYGNVYAIKALVARGADFNKMAECPIMLNLQYPGLLLPIEGSPLLIALVFNRFDAVKYLCGIITNPFPNKFEKNRALNTARAWKNDEMLDLIQSYVR